MKRFFPLLVLPGLFWPFAAFAQEQTYRWEWEMRPMWWAWSVFGVGMMIFMLLFWVVLIVGLVVVVRWLVERIRGVRPDSAIDILRQRYARGEITKDEFEAKKKDIAS